jgi:hypothetical protein
MHSFHRCPDLSKKTGFVLSDVWVEMLCTLLMILVSQEALLVERFEISRAVAPTTAAVAFDRARRGCFLTCYFWGFQTKCFGMPYLVLREPGSKTDILIGKNSSGQAFSAIS